MAVLLIACTFGNSMGAADKAVAEFHSRYNAQDFHGIYADADPQFRQVASESDWSQFIGRMQSILGAYQEGKQVSANRTWNSSAGTQVELSYAAIFASGDTLTETFQWQLDGERAKLLGYNIDASWELLARQWPMGYHRYNCTTRQGVRTCEGEVGGPEGVQIGSDADSAVEVMRDGAVQVEHHACGPIGADRIARCTYVLEGAIFQGGLHTTTFTMANGEQRTLSFRSRCRGDQPEGQICP